MVSGTFLSWKQFMKKQNSQTKMENLEGQVKEVTEEQYFEMLNVLPPFYLNVINGVSVKGFAVSEPYNHIETDGKKWVPTYAAYVRNEGKFFKVKNTVYFLTAFEAKTSNTLLK